MWPFKRKPKQRRLEVRKSAEPAGPSTWRRFQAAGGIVAVLVALVFCAGVLLLDAWPIDPFMHRVGRYVPADIYARVSFQTRPPRLLTEALIEIEANTPAVLSPEVELLKEITQTLKDAPALLGAEPTETQPAHQELLDRFGVKRPGQKRWKPYLEDQAKAKDYEGQIDTLTDKLQRVCIVDSERLREVKLPGDRVFVTLPEGRQLKHKIALIYTARKDSVGASVSGMTEELDGDIRSDVENYLLSMLTERPLYDYDADATAQEIELAKASKRADPPAKRYETGRRLVIRSIDRAATDARGLSEADLIVLRAEHDAFRRFEREHRPWRLWGRLIGRAALLLSLTLLACVYIQYYRRRIVINHWRAMALAMLMLLMLAINKTLVYGVRLDPHVAVLGVLMATIILTIAYDQRFALAMGFILSMLITFQMRSDFAMFLTLSAAVACSALTLREVRSRSRLIEISAIAAAAVFVATCALGMVAGTPWPFVLKSGLWGGGFALLVGFLVQGILPLIERVFNIATSMTLLEWCDASKPLLKRLAMMAPGTYNHSLQLGTICEAAADAIGARGLLVRVGAYYHDIGKTYKPDYFVENEAGSGAKHAKLRPEMSRLIIIGHVKDGVELARQYGLPSVLDQFIATHHGTTVVRYFYHAATEQRRGENDRLPEESEFRYPGPKPQTKEAGILMLADAAESSVRATTEPTATRIETQVHTMVQRRLMDGQLDQCDLTLKEVHQIEESLVKSLCSIYHARIAYPTPVGEKAAPGEGVANSKPAGQ